MENEFSFFTEEIEPLTFCDKNIGFEISKGLYRPPYKITPTTGENHDFNNCSGCKTYHAKIVENANEFFARFPDCCEKHKKLKKLGGFDRNHYANTSELVADKVIYTKQHFLNFLDTEDWYKEITDYITYCVFSFGSIPFEYGNVPYINQYFFFTKNYIKNSKIKKEYVDRKLKILDFLENYGVSKNKDSVSFNVLIKTYEKWYKIFPFELSFFQHLKENYRKIPLGAGKPDFNKYLNMASIKPFSKEELINSLVRLTNTILTQINTKQLFEQELITDANKIKLELILQNRKIELNAGYVKGEINEEQVYRKMLKKWFKDEKKFIDEITPLLSVTPQQNKQTENDILKTALNKFGFYSLDKVKTLQPDNQQKLVNLIKTNKLPYNIAMFDYLGFIKHLETQFTSKFKLNIEIAKWFNSDKEGRAVKANISTLLKNSTEDKKRYTAYLHKETVQTDYQALK